MSDFLTFLDNEANQDVIDEVQESKMLEQEVVKVEDLDQYLNAEEKSEFVEYNAAFCPWYLGLTTTTIQ